MFGNSTLTTWDYVIFCGALLATAAMPFYSKFISRKETTKDDYVFATGKISMCALMLSITRGLIGTKAFLGFPSELYYRGSGMWETLFGTILAYPLIAYFVVPVYYNLNITSLFQYLDMRFHSRLVRCLTSLSFIVRSLQKLGVTIFTPCVVMEAAMGIPFWVTIVVVSVISIIFNLLSGIQSAIKIDVVQGVILIACCAAIIIQGTITMHGFGAIIGISQERGRLDFFNFDLDPTIRVTTISATVGQFFITLSVLGFQQNYMQRYRSLGSLQAVTKMLLFNVPLVTVLFSLSWVVGMVIFANYANCDPLSLGYISKIDEIIPFYVEDKFGFLPGFMGLFVASIFISSIGFAVSNINSAATCTWEDFLQPFEYYNKYADGKQVVAIKVIGTFYGIISIFIAYGVGNFSGLIESSMMMASVTVGPMLGVFLLAMIFPCANWKGAATGMVVSYIFIMWMAIGSEIWGESGTRLLSLTTEGCSNTSFNHVFPKTDPSVSLSPPSPTPEVVLSNYNDDDLPSFFYNVSVTDITPAAASRNILTAFYSVTYMYYSLFGCAITIIVGILVSYATGCTEEEIYDDTLLSPWALKISKWFPGEPRRFSSSKVFIPQKTYSSIANGIAK